MFELIPTLQKDKGTPTSWPLLPCPEEFEEVEWIVGKIEGRVLISGLVWILALLIPLIVSTSIFFTNYTITSCALANTFHYILFECLFQ